MYNKIKIIFIIQILWLFISLPIFSSTPLQEQFDDFAELNIEDLLNQEVSIATKTKQRISEAPSIVTVITTKDIKNMGARNLKDVLRTVPGFDFGMKHIGYTEFGIRGIITQNSEKIKILIDDLPVNEHLEGSGTIVFADLVLENIDRIEIIRGPGSALYGANAFVGVINIISKNINQINGIETYCKTGNFETRQLGILAGKQINNINISAHFDYFYTEGDHQPIKEDALINDPLNSDIGLTGTPKGVTRESRDKLTASLNINYKNYYLKSFFVNLNKKHFITSLNRITTGSRPHPSQIQGMAGKKFEVKNVTIEPRIYSLLYEADNIWNNSPPGFKKIEQNGDTTVYIHGIYELNGGKQRTYGSDIKLLYDLNEKNKWILGTGYENIRFYDLITKANSPTTDKNELTDAPPIMTEEPTRTIISGFIQNQWLLSEAATLTTGARIDHYNDAGTTINPRFGLVWRPSGNIICKILYAHAFRAPTFVESYLNFGNGYVIGNKNNKPETIKTKEIEISYNILENLVAKVNYFHNSINNLINAEYTYDDSGTVTKIEYTNFNEEVVVQGVETEIKLALGTKFYGYSSYSYQYGKNEKTDVKLIGMANHIFNMGINFRLNKHFNLNSTVTHIGKRKRAAGDNRPSTPAYSYVSAALMLNLKTNLEINLASYNLFDSDIRYPDISRAITYDFPQEGRSFIASIRYKL